MKTFQNLTLRGSTGNFQTPIESFSYQFERQKWKSYTTPNREITNMMPVNLVLGGEFSIVKITDGRSDQIMNANTDSKQGFTQATILIKTDKSSLTLNFLKVFPISLSKKAGKDTITFSYETTNIPRIPDIDMLLWKHANGGILK